MVCLRRRESSWLRSVARTWSVMDLALLHVVTVAVDHLRERRARFEADPVDGQDEDARRRAVEDATEPRFAPLDAANRELLRDHVPRDAIDAGDLPGDDDREVGEWRWNTRPSGWVNGR